MKRGSSLRLRRPKPIGRSVLDWEGSRNGHRSTLRRLRARPPSEQHPRCSCTPCSGRWRRRWRSGSPDRWGPGSRPAARGRSSASRACRNRTAGRGARESPAGPGRGGRRPRGLDRPDLMALAHGRQDRARLDRLAVHLHHAGPQLEVSQPQCVPVRPEGLARSARAAAAARPRRMTLAVYHYRDFHYQPS